MTQARSPEDRLQLSRSLVREWKGFSAEVLSYDASLGITGQLLILFSSNDGQHFLMKCGPCHLLETRFKWQVERLEIDTDRKSKKVTIVDLSNNLKIITNLCTIDRLWNYDAVCDFYDRLSFQRELPIDFSGWQKPNCLPLESRRFEIPYFDLGEFKAYNNILRVGLKYIPFNSKTFSLFNRNRLSEYSLSLCLIKPTYIWFSHKYLKLNEITVRQEDNIFRLTDRLKNNLCIECNDIKVCDTMEFICYGSSVSEKIEWFSISTILSLEPRRIISL
jgi:hypothetical protein